MAYESSTEGGADIGASVFHFDASQPDRVNISDAELLFRGHFARSGPDLVLTGDDGERHLVPGYFASENHPTLYAPNGAHLSGDVVDMLAGSPTPGHYAQAQQTLPPDAIGKVQKVVGSVTVIRNGTAVGLHVGDAIHKSDVIETGVNSSCGIAFPDGTALDLVANTRMALNDYTYDVAGSANNALFTLVEGTFAFVAGQVAHTGNGMKISTPVATMGIRGTVGLFKTDRTVVGSNLGQVWSVFLHEDLDGSHHLGRIAFIDQDPNSPTYGQVFYLLDSSDYIAYLEPRSGASPLVRLEPINNSKLFDDRHYFDDLTQILNSFNNANPQSPSGTQGSGDNPDFLKINQQLLGPGGGGPSYNYNPRNGDLPPILTPTFGGVPVQDGKLNTNTSLIFVWNGTGTWPSTSPWNQGSAPNSPIDQVIIQSGTATFPGGQTSLAQLTVDPGATLDITGGLFTVGQLVDNGTIIVDGDPPTVVISGPATIGPGHVMDAVGSGTEIDFIGSTLDNQGVVAALQHGVIAINGESVTNESGGVLAAIGGSLQINNSVVTNAGILGAGPDGTVTIDHSTIANTGGVIAAVSFPGHSGGIVNLSDATIVGGTLITSGLAGDDGSAIDVVAASGANMSVLDGSTSAVTVGGYVDVLSGAQLELKGTIHLDGAFGEIAVGGGAQAANLIIDGNVTLDTDGESELAESIVLQGGHILGTASGRLENTNAVIAGYGEIDGPLNLVNDASGVINANVGKAALVIDPAVNVSNAGILEASNGGILDLLADVTNTGKIQADADSTVLVDGASIDNSGGVISAGIGSPPAAPAGGENSESVPSALTALISEVVSTFENISSGDAVFDGAVTTTVGYSDPTSFVNLDNATITGGTLETGKSGIASLDGDGPTVLIVSDGITIPLSDSGGPPDTYHTNLSYTSTGVIETVANPDGSASTSTFDDVTNEGFVLVNADTTLVLRDTFTNDGEVVVGTGTGNANLAINGSVTLTGDGTGVIWLSSSTASSLSGVAGGDNVLENVNNLIIGAGKIGGNLQLINDTSGFIVADDGKLTIDTGHTVTNDGQMQAENHGTLDVLDDVVGSGGVTISGGSTADFAGSFNEAVTFGATSTSALNTFELAETNYGGTVHDFAVGDGIELANLTFASSVSAVWDQAAGELEIFNGTQEIEEIKLSGSFAANAFTVITAPDGSGNTEVVLKEGVEEEWINTAGGSWSVAGNWSEGVPTSASDAFVDLDGNYTITIAPSDHATAQSLTISDAGATLNGSGTLTLDALENHGTIEVTSFAEFTINELGDDIENFGTIQAIDGASLIVNHSGPSVNEITGIIKADGCGSSVTLNNNLDNANYGKVLAANRGTVTINVADTGAGIGGNFGCMEALNAGAMIIIGDMFNAADATIAAHGPYSTVTFEAADYAADAPTILDNEGNILATDYGTVQIADVGIDNNGTIGAKCHGTVEIAFSLIDNQGGTIAAGGHGSAVDLYHVGIAGGTLQTGDLTDSNHGVIDIVAPGEEAGNTVDFDGSLHGALTVDAFVRVEAGADLALSGTINNNGTIDLVDPEISGGHLVIDGKVHLNGSGTVTLDGGNAEIVGANGNEANALYNDNTIAGAGLIGGNDLTLINEKFGLIDANVADQTLTIDTDHTFENDGTLKADGGTLLVDDNVTGGGSVVITDGGTADFAGIFNESAAFRGAGTLVLQHSLSDDDYSGMISGFGPGDVIDLADLTYSKCLTDVWNSSTDTLSIYDNHHHLEETLQFTGSYCQGNFALVQDNGTGTEVVFTPNVSDDSWLHASNGSWTTDNDWSGGVPTSDLNAAIDVNGSYTVTTCGEVTAKSLTIGDVHATLKGTGTLSIPTIVNDGTIDTDGLLTITGNVTGTGGLHIENGARLVLDGTCTDTVTYEGGHGTLEITSDGSGTPFSVTGGALQQNDVIYLPHINFDAAADSYDANTDVLTVGDGHGHTVTIDIVGGLAPGHSFSFETLNGGTLVQDPADSISAGGVVTLADTQAASAETVGFTAGNNGSQYIGAFSLGAVTNGNAGASVDWQFSLDDDQINLAPGQTVTQSYDVTAAAGQNGAASQTVSISIGGPGNDNFVFAPGVGADTIVNFNPQADTIELDHFANVQNQQQLAEAITTDASGDAVIELGHGDSITIPGVSTSYMQQHLQSLVHLH